MTDSVEQFVRSWPVIHKVRQDSQRDYQLPSEDRRRILDEHPAFARWAQTLGFAA